jgi:hypothetical protein
MKNTDRLEEFVKTHRDDFDNLEPSPDLWKRIQEDSKKQKIVKMRSYLLRIAAVIAIVVLSTVLIIDNNFFVKKGTAKVTDPELLELLETEQFYAQQVSGKLDEIRKCYTTFPEIKNDVEADLNELETMYNSLKNDLKDNISNKPVIEAMIENNRFRLKLVDSVLEQIKC